MPSGPLIVLTGPPGAGKTTAARELASRFQPLACVLESDWWWTTIVSGRIPPWESAAEPIRKMWQAFSQLGEYEDNVIDSSGLTVAETVERAWSMVADGSVLI